MEIALEKWGACGTRRSIEAGHRHTEGPREGLNESSQGFLVSLAGRRANASKERRSLWRQGAGSRWFVECGGNDAALDGVQSDALRVHPRELCAPS